MKKVGFFSNIAEIFSTSGSKSAQISNLAQIRAVLVRMKNINDSHDFDSFNFSGILEAIQIRKVASMNFMKALFFRSYARKIVVDATAVLLFIPAFGNHNIKTCTKLNAVCSSKSAQNIFEIAFRLSRFHLIFKYFQYLNNPEMS